MTKILKPYTIIPQELYVSRDADRQLEESIRDMGRPPYILVARQMGKTNLLINAKRNLPQGDDLFVYIDMSNSFPTARECLRNIIDRIVETNENASENLTQSILANRDLNLTTHSEHGKELRLCLKSIKGKIVVILDEIDGLTKSVFSDEIFSQIRSIYFERINFSEYERLTYVLSGVAEPNEIIKNAKISPFNIGQKIYLNDFSFEEFEYFIYKANLDLDHSLNQHIYGWTSGNPRMTWDICSKLEDLKLNSINITNEQIDFVVHELYLTSFDRAPIDHIRDLVTNDISIRNAIIEIKYNKGDLISDQVRRKLYLSGIIASSSLSGKAIIKNKVIEQSLSDKWLKEVNDQAKDYYASGNVAFDQGNFYEAYNNYKEYLDRKPANIPGVFNWKFALCCFRLTFYQEALNYFDLYIINKSNFEDIYLQKLNISGSCYYYLGNFPKSRACFLEVIAAGKNNYTYFDSKISIISTDTISKEDMIQSKNDALSAVGELELYKDNLSDNEFKELRSHLSYILGNIYRELKNTEDAILEYKKASDLAHLYSLPSIYINLIEIDEDTHVNELVDIIIENQLKPFQFDPQEPFKFTSSVLYKVAILTYKENNSQFEKLANYIVNDLYATGSTIYSLKYHLAVFANEIFIGEKNTALTLLDELYKNRSEIVDEGLVFKVIKQLALVNLTITTYDSIYINLLRKNKDLTEFDISDLKIFAKNILSLIDNKLYRRALDWTDLALNYSSNKLESTYYEYSMLMLYYKILIFKAIANKPEILKTANKVLEIVKINQNSKAVIGEREYSIIQQEAINAIGKNKISTVVNSNKYGRNDTVTVIYENNITKTGKFKKFELDISTGKCRIS